MERRLRLVALVAALASVVGACGGGDDDDEAEGSDETTTTESSESSEATTTTLSDEDEVLAAYRAANAVLAVVSDPPDPEHPDLLAHYSGDTLSRLQAVLRDLQAQGYSYVTSVENSPTVVSLAGDTAVVEDCFVDRTQLIDTVSREPLGDLGETTQQATATLDRIDGVWKIVRSEQGSEPCTPG